MIIDKDLLLKYYNSPESEGNSIIILLRRILV